jgi:hypothetical protein
MTRIVRAYHGTTLSAASDIYHRRGPFRLSDKPGNWLGRGAYFFEENLPQAIDWAIHQVNLRARLGVIDSPAIFVADLDLTHCLDFCNSQWHAHLQFIAEKLVEAGVLPQQHGPTLTTAGSRTLRPTTFVIADYPMPAHTALEHFADIQSFRAAMVVTITLRAISHSGPSGRNARCNFEPVGFR